MLLKYVAPGDLCERMQQFIIPFHRHSIVVALLLYEFKIETVNTFGNVKHPKSKRLKLRLVRRAMTKENK